MGDNDPFMRNQNAAVQGRAKAQNRANVLQLKMIGQNHPTGLTSNLLKLFEPRPPLEYKPPPEKRKCPPYTGMAHLVSHFAEPNDPEYAPPVPKAETPAEKRARIHQSRLQKGAEKVAEELQKYDPNSDPNIAGDPYKTLFVAKLSYETTESRLKREFESYGPIKRVGTHKKPRNGFDSQKPRGYAFIEYMHTRDMKAAYKQGDGKKIDGRRVLVDVERGRTVPNWRPRRLGGGLGTSRISGDDGSQRNSVREQQQPGGSSRSEEPRAREDRSDREKSRERARDKDVEREKSHERSHDKPRDRDREDRHRDRDRRDKGHDRDRDRDRGSRGHDRDRTRDRDRDHRRERTRDRERDYDADRDKDRDVVDYDSKHERHSKRDHRGYDQPEAEDEGEWHRSDYDQYEHHRERGSSRYDDANDGDRYDHYPNEAHHRYDQRDQDSYHYGRASSRDNMDQD